MKSEISSVGFIGMGAMGQRMARRLVDAKFALTVFDRSAQQTKPLTDAGANASSSVRELAANCPVVISCLHDDHAVLEIYSGSQGVLSAAKPGTIVIEMSTVSPDTSQTLAELGRECGVEVLDVPVSGSTPAAEQGTLVLFGGGDQRTFEQCEPIFKALARQYFYLGPNGSGSSMKLVVNTLLGVSMQAIAEAAALGERMGLERARMLDVLANTSVVAPAHRGKLTRAAHGEYSAQFTVGLMAKDFKLILDRAYELRVPMPATTASYAVNRVCAQLGDNLDFSAVIEEMRRRASIVSILNESV
jgi:3-hydroxyisobutyrate dehydrogenase-like beta-hydroxyacid dehydrogenase